MFRKDFRKCLLLTIEMVENVKVCERPDVLSKVNIAYFS